MNYILTNYSGIEIYSDEKSELNCSIKYFLNSLAQKYLFNIEGYFKAVRINFSFKNEIPIYYSKELLIFPIGGYRNHHSVFINYFMIKCVFYIDKQTVFIFQNGDSLLVKRDSKYVKKCFKKIREIQVYINGIK